MGLPPTGREPAARRVAAVRWRRLVPWLLAALVGSCTGPNPAFRADDKARPDSGGARGDAAAVLPDLGSDAVASLPAAPGTSSVDLRTALLGHWSFEEPPGEMTVKDLSDHRHDGRLEGLDRQSARVGNQRGQQALEFPAGAVLPGVMVPMTAAIAPQTFTVAAWAFRTSSIAGTPMTVISRQLGSETRQVFDLAFDGDTVYIRLSQTSGTDGFAVESPLRAPLNRWLHVAASYDGTTLRLYHDGELIGWQDRAWTFPSTANPVYIGTNKNVDNDEPMVGLLDDVLYYGRALPAQAIVELAHGAVPP